MAGHLDPVIGLVVGAANSQKNHARNDQKLHKSWKDVDKDSKKIKSQPNFPKGPKEVTPLVPSAPGPVQIANNRRVQRVALAGGDDQKTPRIGV